jgi:hypothetical protein
MTKPIAGKRKQKIVAPVPPVEVARLSRYDYAVAMGRTAQATMADVTAARTASQAVATAKRRAIRSGAVLTPDGHLDMDIVFAKPLQVSVAMQTSYAAELLKQLRGAKKPRRGECHQISVDCPVKIVMDAAMLVAMTDKLEVEVGGEM